ncbi:MAG: DMT family transporter [Methylococcales bacterium]|nr:DMT family transporter [Methylococcales bacterium]
MSDHLKGLLITVLGVLVLSPDTVLIRLSGVDQWTLLVYRGLLMAVGMTFLSSLFDKAPLKQQYRKIGKTGLLATLYFSISTVAFLNAVAYTSIAHTLVIIATAPLFSALYGWVLFGEPLRISTLLAIACVIVGM